MSTPRTTVVIPCFNHGRFVAEALRSCLAQEQADVRVIIVNDGSDDGTTPAACDACVAQSPARVVVVHQENKGLAAARNAGAAKAGELGGAWVGDYLTFLDADDWIEPAFVTTLHLAIVGRELPVRVMLEAPGDSVRQMASLPVAGAEQIDGHAVGARASTGAAAAMDAVVVPGLVRGSNGHPAASMEPETEDASQPRISHAYCQERLVELHQMIWAVP
ncbi:MAG: glycosyltransferase family 2 protein, partial [Pyrinomonadaceae bacterium]|nr:glycosyltransferase family 2 protein [Phycisphaerales bacterium]